MTPALLGISALSATAALLGGLAYRRTWRRIKGEAFTPTGYGAFLALFLAIGAAVAGLSANLLIAHGVIVVATAAYWIDDARGLGVGLRLAIQFGVGAVVAGLVLQPTFGADPIQLAAFCLAGGALNVILTNVVNFYDGADLNLGLFIALTAISILVFGRDGGPLAVVAVFLLAFVLPFGLLNRKPRSIYLGDSGSFAFACFLTMVAAGFLRADGGFDGLVLAPLALPLLDVAVVLTLRVAKKEDLLSRNYYHLYQRIHLTRQGFSYLIPQIVNVILIAICTFSLRGMGVDLFYSAVTATIFVTTTFYAVCFRVFLGRPNFR